MADERYLWEHVRSDEDAVRALTELGPLARRADAAGHLDPPFRLELRERLLVSTSRQSVDRSLTRHVLASGRKRWWRATLAGASVIAAALIVLLVLRGGAPHRRPVAIATPSSPVLHPPSPRVADLVLGATKGFQGQGGGGLPVPELSGFDSTAPIYQGHLVLSARAFPNEPHFLPAYHLAGPGFDVPRAAAIARRIGIQRPVVGTRSPVDHVLWKVAAMGGPALGQPVRSLAISTRTGELIFHSAPHVPPSRLPPALNRKRASASARRWLATLGWPSSRMPVLTAQPDTLLLPPSAGIPWQVTLGWAIVGRASESQAEVIVMPEGQVIEARLWTPVVGSGHVDTTAIGRAWERVRKARVPAFVQGMASLSASGVGTLKSASTTYLIDTAGRTQYLVPAYQFQGVVHLRGFGTRRWTAIVPAVRQG